MSNAYEIPLKPQAQTFLIALGTSTYRLTLRWNSAASVWVLDIDDAYTNKIVHGIALVANVDLLAPYTDKGFQGQLIATTDHNINIPPTYSNLGSLGHLYFVTT